MTSGGLASKSCMSTSSEVVSFCGDVLGDWMATRFFAERDEAEEVGCLVDGSGRGMLDL